MNNYQKTIEPQISDYISTKRRNLAVALILTGMLACAVMFSFLILSLNLVQVVLIDLSMIVSYSILLYLLIGNKSPVPIIQNIIETREKPVIKEIYIDRPVIREVIIEKQTLKPVIRNVYVPEYREVTKPVYIERKRKKLNIPKYKFLGSTQTKTYHLRACRFSKLIKRKYKLSNNSKKYFISKKFKSCKSCISKSKKR